jgi:hypothetical protein
MRHDGGQPVRFLYAIALAIQGKLFNGVGRWRRRHEGGSEGSDPRHGEANGDAVWLVTAGAKMVQRSRPFDRSPACHEQVEMIPAPVVSEPSRESESKASRMVSPEGIDLNREPAGRSDRLMRSAANETERSEGW